MAGPCPSAPSSPAQHISAVFATPCSISLQLSMSNSPSAQTHHPPLQLERVGAPEIGTNGKSHWFYWPFFTAWQWVLLDQAQLQDSSPQQQRWLGLGGAGHGLSTPRGPSQPGAFRVLWAQGTTMKLCTAPSREILPREGPELFRETHPGRNSGPKQRNCSKARCVWNLTAIQPQWLELPQDTQGTPSDTTGTHRHHRDSLPTLGRNTRQEAHLKHCPAFIYAFKRNPKLAQGLSLNSSSNHPVKAVYSLGTLKTCYCWSQSEFWCINPTQLWGYDVWFSQGIYLEIVNYIFRNSKYV